MKKLLPKEQLAALRVLQLTEAEETELRLRPPRGCPRHVLHGLVLGLQGLHWIFRLQFHLQRPQAERKEAREKREIFQRRLFLKGTDRKGDQGNE